MEELVVGLETAFINSEVDSNSAYRPEFVSNDYRKGKKVSVSIERELRSCQEFYISVAFITEGGLAPLKQVLAELRDKGVRGKILTTSYLSFTEPKALKSLAAMPNIELRIYDSNLDGANGFHTKGYIFRNDDLYHFIIGSSNMTASAFAINKEWNTKLVSTSDGEMLNQMMGEFNALWNDKCTVEFDEFIQDYELRYNIVKEQIKMADIQTFHNHPFHLYEGERLQDMIRSIKEHGVLNPVIVRKLDKGYEMLSGHNRANAVKLAGLAEVPAIVKAELSDEEAYVYVIETNLMQRSFNDLMPSEKAAVMAAHYDKMCCQGKRNDIIRELKILNGEEPDDTCCHNGNKLKSLDVIAYEYGFSSRNAARYLRLNYLIQPFKNLMDEGKIALLAAVDISYLIEDEQKKLWEIVEHQGLKIKPVYAEKLRNESGNLTEEKIAEILEALQLKHTDGNAGVSLKLPKTICNKYFEGMNSKEMASVVEQALAAWFEGKEAAVV